MEPIEGTEDTKPKELKDYRKIRVKESFCHDSYWHNERGREYGKLGKNDYGVLYECVKCNPDGEMMDGYEYCDGCNCMINKEDMDIRALDEFGNVMCEECYLKEKGFDTEQIYVKTDAWRGHGSNQPANPNTAIAVECCCIGHDQNDDIVKIVEDWLTKHGYNHIRTFHQTSNIFSVNLQILAKKDRPLTDDEIAQLKALDDLFVDYYTRGFSIMSGQTFEIDLNEFQQRVDQI